MNPSKGKSRMVVYVEPDLMADLERLLAEKRAEARQQARTIPTRTTLVEDAIRQYLDRPARKR